MVTTLEGRTLERFELIACNAPFHRAIMGDLATGEFALYDPSQLVEGKAFTDLTVALLDRGFRYWGVVGIVDGSPRSALTAVFDGATMKRMSDAFVQEFETHADAAVRERVEQRVFAGWMKYLNPAEA